MSATMTDLLPEPLLEDDVPLEPATTPRDLPRALRPFRYAAYRRLAIALVLSTFASGVWVVAMVWEVIRIGGGPAQLSVVSTAGAAGVLLPALLGGLVADRIPQKRILLCVATVEVSGMSVVALLSLTDSTQVWQLAGVTFATGIGTAFYYPAYTAWLPALVDEADLMSVNGFEGMVRPTLGQAIGPGVAGVVVGAVSAGAAVSVAAVLALAALVALTFVPLTGVRHDSASAQQSGNAVSSALHEVRAGVGYMVRTPWLLATLLFVAVAVVMMGGYEVLIPFLIKDRLGGGPGDHAMVMGAFGIGGALGAMVTASVKMPRRYLTMMNLVWALGCVPLTVMGLATEIWMIVVATFCMGALFSAGMVIWGTLLQRRVPAHMLGRVASLDFFVSISLMPVSMAVAGPVSDLLGLRTTFYIAGIVPGLVAVAAVIWARMPQDEIAHPLSD